MPGGTSGEGKTPTSQQAQADKQRRSSRPSKNKSTDTNDLLATILAAAAQAANQSSVSSSISQQAAANKFDPAALLAAQQGLDAAYQDAEGNTQDSPTSGTYGPQAAAAVAARRATLPATASEESGVVAAQQAYDDQLRIRRADALNVDPNRDDPMTNKEVKKSIDRLTWDEYNNMTPLQQAAVDYNSMLVKAVKADNRTREQYVDTDSEQYQTYATAFEEMFPNQDVGSVQHSPNTMAVLRQIGYEGGAEGRLDDFLNLDASLTAKDLKNLNKTSDLGLRRAGAGDMFGSPVKEDRMDLLGSLASSTQDAQAEVLARGNEILANFGSVAMAEARSDDVLRLGGVAPSAVPSNETKRTDFDTAFNLLADKDLEAKGISVDTVFGSIQDNMSEKERDQFIKYVKERLVTATQGTLPVTDSENVQNPRTPEEIAKLLQLSGFAKGGA